MKILTRISIVFLLSAATTFAANFDTVIGSKVQDTGGGLLPSGQICFLGTDNNDRPISYQAGGGGQVISTPVCASVTSGLIGSLSVADSLNTTPSGIYYRVTVTNLNSGQKVLLYKGVQVAANPFNFDNYGPTCPGCNLVPPSTTSVPGNFSVNGNLSVVGSCTGCSASNPFYQTVQENGVSQTQRSTTNYNSGVVASDVGGKTEVDLASQIAGAYTIVNDVQSTPLGVSQSNAGALGATTYYIRVACNFPWSLGLPGTEQTFAASASNVITVTSPTTNQCGGSTAPSGVFTSAATYNVYVSNTAGGGSGAETLQASGIAIGANWTEPNTGLVAGSAMPTTYTFDANYGNVQRLRLTTNVTSTSLVNAQSGMLMTIIIQQSATGGYTFTWPTNFNQWLPDIDPFANLFTTLTGAFGDAGGFGRASFPGAEHVIPFTATPSVDSRFGTVQRMVLTGNVTAVNVANYYPGAHGTLVFCQDGTGGRTVAFNNAFWVNPPASINLAANACTPVDFVIDALGTGSTTGTKARVLNNNGTGLNTVTFSATPIFDAALGNLQLITLTGAVTSSTLLNGLPGQGLNFDICQDATGSRTFVWPTNMKGTMTIGTTASKCNLQSFVFDGATWYATSLGVTNQ